MTQPLKTAQEMYPLIERYLEGHKTQKAFSAEHQITPGQLNYWLAKYRQETARPKARASSSRPDAFVEEPSFVEITPTNAPVAQPLMEVVYPHGVRLRLFSPVEAAYLGRLIALNDLGA